jgi:hypothetical protein
MVPLRFGRAAGFEGAGEHERGHVCSVPAAQRSAGVLRPWFRRGGDRRLAGVKTGTAIALGALLGLAFGIVVSVITNVPFAPEAGLVLGALAGWVSRREHA